MKKIRIIIADDHELFRNGLKELLNKHADVEIVKMVSDGQELMDYVSVDKTIDIILLDISMPKMDGFDVLTQLQQSSPDIKPIIISMHDEGNYIAKCAQKGAYSYLLKNTDQEELINTIRKVSKGKKNFSPSISAKMIDYMSENSFNDNILSKKETEILELISKGLTTKDIAKLLYVSSRTVETHRSNILKKIDVKNTAELIKKAVQLKLIT